MVIVLRVERLVCGQVQNYKLQTTNCKTTKGGNVKKSEEGVLNSTPADLRDGTPHNDVRTSGRLLILDQISII